MSQHLKMFEWLMYGALVLAVVSIVMTGGFGAGEYVVAFILIAIAAGLVWFAARKGSRVSAYILVVLTVLGVLILVADLSGGSIPWLADLADPASSMPVLIVDAIGSVMMVVALWFYFFGGSRSPQP